MAYKKTETRLLRLRAEGDAGPDALPRMYYSGGRLDE